MTAYRTYSAITRTANDIQSSHPASAPMCDLAIAPNTKKRIPRYKATTARNGLISKTLFVIEGRRRPRIPEIMRRTNGKVIAISLDSRAAINAADAIQTYFALRVLRYRRNINIEQKANSAATASASGAANVCIGP